MICWKQQPILVRHAGICLQLVESPHKIGSFWKDASARVRNLCAVSHLKAESRSARLTVRVIRCIGESGKQHDAITRKTIKLASLAGVDRVVMMSGCPGGGRYQPQWVTTGWPPEMQTILDYQWNKVMIPIGAILSPTPMVLPLQNLLRPSECLQRGYVVEITQCRGPNSENKFRPNHLMWMGADPLAAVRALGDAIYHVHARIHGSTGIAIVTASWKLKPARRWRPAPGATSPWVMVAAMTGGMLSAPI